MSFEWTEAREEDIADSLENNRGESEMRRRNDVTELDEHLAQLLERIRGLQAAIQHCRAAWPEPRPLPTRQRQDRPLTVAAV